MTSPNLPRRTSAIRTRLSGVEREVPLRLHAVTVATGAEAAGSFRDGARLVAYRDLGAIVTESSKFALDPISIESTNRHRGIVDAVFRHHVIVPAPVGIMFRSEAILERWMELHYVSLSGALEFFQDRRGARVHICRAQGSDDNDPDADATEAAAEAFRAFRRVAAASVPLRPQHVTATVLSAAFLVDMELWESFTTIAKAQREANISLRFVVTGPWAPYDFVHMHFGA